MASVGQDETVQAGSSFAIGGAAIDAICSELSKLDNLERVLEFGSGASTVALAHRLPEVCIESVDHTREWSAKVPPDLEYRVRVYIVPIKSKWIHGVFTRSYDFTPSGEYDAVIIDGPPVSFLNGRFSCLLTAASCLKPGGVIIMDDARRPTELFWASLFLRISKAKARFLDVGHGIILFDEVKVHGEQRLPRLIQVGLFVTSFLQMMKGKVWRNGNG